jgi:hypothetical protein
MAPNQEFVKIWEVKNTGTCTWRQNLYSLRFLAGHQMSGATLLPSAVVPPGETTTLSQVLIAPEAPGDYTGSWRLITDNGYYFGAVLTVRITVQ